MANNFFSKLNSGQLINRRVNILAKSFYSPSLKNVAGLESVQLRFEFSTHLPIFFFPRTASIVKKKINMDNEMEN